MGRDKGAGERERIVKEGWEFEGGECRGKGGQGWKEKRKGKG